MAFQRPASAFRNELGGTDFPFEDGRYTLYVALACPWANGTLQVARLLGLVAPLGSDGSECGRMRVAVVHPTWQYTDPEADAQAARQQALAAGVAVGEPHAGWVFSEPGRKLLPLATLQRPAAVFGADAGPTPSAEEVCTAALHSGERGFALDAAFLRDRLPEGALQGCGIASERCGVDPSRHGCKTLRHLYEACGGFMAHGVRATTPMLYCARTDSVVSNESTDLIRAFCAWARMLRQEEGGREGGVDLYPEGLRSEIDAAIEWVYTINNGVYRCGFACSQPAYSEAAGELEQRMLEVERHMESRAFLVGDALSLADVRLFNTLIRMDEVYVAYFKCYFASLFAPFGAGAGPKFPNLLRHTVLLYTGFPEIRESVCMDDIRHHYFTSHAVRNSFAVVPREVGVLRKLEEMGAQ